LKSGKLHGVEALLRLHEEAGFKSIGDVFDRAFEQGVLYTLDLKLREKALKKFKKIEFYEDIKLFYNLDNRVLEMPDFSMGNTEEILMANNIKKSSLCFEISEKYNFKNTEGINKLLNVYKNEGYNIALDDFGSGFSNLQNFYKIDIDLLKIDRFFIKDVEKSSKKKFFLTSIINLVHTLGGIVVAEGVETEAEFQVCKTLGCDLLQGYFLQKPTLNIEDIKIQYDHVKISVQKNKLIENDRKIIENHLVKLEGIHVDRNMDEVLEKLRENNRAEVFPICDSDERFLGVVKELKIKNYLLAPFGKEFLKKKNIKKFMDRAICIQIDSSIEEIVEQVNVNDNIDFIVVLEGERYKGYLNQNAIIKIISEKNINEARNQNPLTKLAGNIQIGDYIRKTLKNSYYSYFYTYFDFNNFKGYNDKYGFKVGDEVILLFGEILKDHFNKQEHFIGHIGGDDFFLGIENKKNKETSESLKKIKDITRFFRKEVEKYYGKEDLEQGYINTFDRDGEMKKIPIMSVAAAILEIPLGKRDITIDEISTILFKMKKKSKISENYICHENIF
jgi:diguanylate cyclase (GGDEF)-like protein